ncbi:MAG: 50S ribosome-binding GTPase, partial [Deltaproteobacteria bacterium]|nr:50S ribosome-binding GTPase [Deltaproteobacteria bacterium]
GKGGRGNYHFVTKSNKVPTRATRGKPGERRKIVLSLELLAQIGLIGAPNAGKSSLLARISSAKPKIAEYPFTTLYPNLGIVQVSDISYTVADLPGLIKGASLGKGLGLRFLKHALRTKVLCHVIDVNEILDDNGINLKKFWEIENELKSYSEELHAKPRIIVVSKIDCVTDKTSLLGIKKAFIEHGYKKVFFISNFTGEGIKELLTCFAELAKAPDFRTIH